MTYSTYLQAPSTKRRITRAVWRRSLPHKLPRRQTVAGLISWMLLIGGIAFTDQHHSLSPSPVLGVATAQAASDTQHGVSQLADGPTGGLLPPGTLAPAGTYANSYTRGQCTWYVASRRQIPAGWGNARSWLTAARRAGWDTGTAPAVGAIAQTTAGYYGHVAVVEAVQDNRVLIAEMNYYGPYRSDERWTNASNFSYIY